MTTLPRAIVVVLSFGAVAVGLRVLAACVDTTPIVIDKGDTFQEDASCLSCLETPAACGELIGQCKADTRCLPVYDCLLAEHCLDLESFDDKINCGIPCAQSEGIVSLNDPVVSTYMAGLVRCSTEQCAIPCNVGDSGVNF